MRSFPILASHYETNYMVTVPVGQKIRIFSSQIMWIRKRPISKWTFNVWVKSSCEPDQQQLLIKAYNLAKYFRLKIAWQLNLLCQLDPYFFLNAHIFVFTETYHPKKDFFLKIKKIKIFFKLSSVFSHISMGRFIFSIYFVVLRRT